MQIGFIFNAQSHQVLHSLPVACVLSRDFPEVDVTVLAQNPAQINYLQALAQYYGATGLHYKCIAPPFPFSRRSLVHSAPKSLTLFWNRGAFSKFDALVMPERTSLKLKRVGVRHTAFIHTTHGAGDDEREWDTRIREFDLVLLPGAKRRDRLLKHDLLRPGHYFVSGYNKFDLVQRMNRQRTDLFSNGRKTVLYNPHHNKQHSSWHKIGHQVLEYFAQSNQFNLIFAPHIRMLDDGAITSEELRRYAGLPHLLLDTGSERSLDMSYSLNADIYLGDWSSQVYEFLLTPRPVIFLNPQQFEWRGNEQFFWWTLGEVAEDISAMHTALVNADEWQPGYEAAQRKAFDYTFANSSQPAPERAAQAIATFLKQGWIDDDLA